MGTVYPMGGKAKLDAKLAGFNHAARNAPWFVLRDLDQDAACAPALVKRLLPTPAKGMHLRIAVHQGESWLLADAERIATFLGVPVSSVPPAPDTIPNAKQALLNLARRSRSRELRAALVPAEGSTASVGKQYSTVVADFTRDAWRPAVAARRSDSLARCIRALESLGR
ncbi:hypothetical protein OV207_01605 [Corallococcus sp. BB11-1]|uniref:hypothetical protein n=1 Tax=Corallococcus sp. BB11-1 TaxID=2996783 RepID=UPI00227169B8|nr:hypothetical protein [Corallococcus sp. BB11-1]MCY1030136.1 hypothetical protein [Corallococcus sp. BB11-1]